jgi:predicted tellurium resistance membrane protein TerC
MNELITSAGLISLFTLTLLEIVLGIDNVIFVSIIMGRMPKENHKRARLLWMIFGIAVRVALLASLGWLVAHGEKPLFSLPIIDKPINLKSIIMLVGGLFLLVKTIGEIHTKLEGDEEEAHSNTAEAKAKSFTALMAQIVLVDMVFSFDSIITAIGIADKIIIMGTAVTIAMIIMFLFSGRIAAFIDKHPTIKMLALSFLVMVGLVLIMEGWAPEKAEALHIKNYLYFGMAFSLIVEMLNIKTRAKSKKAPIQFHEKDIDASMKGDVI